MVGGKQNPLKPGYYWLANSWDNLFLTCLFCNQAKKQLVQKNGKWETVTIGKQNQFPLNDSSLYNTQRNHINWNTVKPNEEKNRLLIDPCIEDPEKLLRYTKEGLIFPSFNSGKKHLMGVTSINVFALERMYLVQERKKRALDLEMQINKVRETLKRLHLSDNVKNPILTSYFKDSLKREVDLLFHFTYKRKIYSAMCRQFVHAFLIDEFNKDKHEIEKEERRIHLELEAEHNEKE